MRETSFIPTDKQSLNISYRSIKRRKENTFMKKLSDSELQELSILLIKIGRDNLKLTGLPNTTAAQYIINSLQ